MENSHIIKQVFGNHNKIQHYLEFLKSQQNGDDTIPPFVPVLHREIACGGDHDYESILINEKSHHKAKNKQIKNQLIQQFDIYSQLQRGE